MGIIPGVRAWVILVCVPPVAQVTNGVAKCLKMITEPPSPFDTADEITEQQDGVATSSGEADRACPPESTQTSAQSVPPLDHWFSSDMRETLDRLRMLKDCALTAYQAMTIEEREAMLTYRDGDDIEAKINLECSFLGRLAVFP